MKKFYLILIAFIMFASCEQRSETQPQGLLSTSEQTTPTADVQAELNEAFLAVEAANLALGLNTSPITNAEWENPHIYVYMDGTIRKQVGTKEVPATAKPQIQFLNSCTELPYKNHPNQSNDDYRNEQRFAGLGNTVIWDHNINRKFMTVIIPYYEALYKLDLTTCNLDYAVRDPYTGKVVRFYNIGQWKRPDDEQTIFNLNKELNRVFGITKPTGAVTFAIRTEDRKNHVAVDYGHKTATLYMRF